jgi:hypothetical protein
MTRVLHVANFSLHAKGAFQHSVSIKLSNGLIRNGHSVTPLRRSRRRPSVLAVRFASPGPGRSQHRVARGLSRHCARPAAARPRRHHRRRHHRRDSQRPAEPPRAAMERRSGVRTGQPAAHPRQAGRGRRHPGLHRGRSAGAAPRPWPAPWLPAQPGRFLHRDRPQPLPRYPGVRRILRLRNARPPAAHDLRRRMEHGRFRHRSARRVPRPARLLPRYPRRAPISPARPTRRRWSPRRSA